METVILTWVMCKGSLPAVKHQVRVRVIPGAFGALQMVVLLKPRPRWLEMQVTFRKGWDPGAAALAWPGCGVQGTR